VVTGRLREKQYAGNRSKVHFLRPDRLASRVELETARVLDSTNNKLQELMQLLYLLSRDPSVPNDARYHVTVAQSEIALLTRQMQNAADAEAVEREQAAVACRAASR
jgi:uncharacterized protein (UPF0147 family)